MIEIIGIIIGLVTSILTVVYQRKILEWWKRLFERPTQMDESDNTVKLVGRSKTLDIIYQHILDKERLITIHGFGGVGKTALVKGFLLKYRSLLEIESYFVELEAHKTTIGLCHGIHEAINGKGISESEQNPEIVIEKLLKRKGRILLVLDNFEQLIQFKKETIEYWIENTEVIILITSIFPMELGKTERKIGLKPLSLPKSSSSTLIKKSESYQLFTQILEEDEIKHDFNRNDFFLLFKIFKGLGGFPFAIEIYAPLLRSMNLKEVLSVVENHIEIHNERINKKHRHSSLNNLIKSLFEGTLSQDQKITLVQCAIFSNPFTLDAALKVIQNDSELPTASILHDLHKKNLIEVTNDSERRYYLLPIFRRYLNDKMGTFINEKEKQDLITRWGEYYVSLGEELNKNIHSIGGSMALDQMASEMENFFDIQQSLISSNPELAARSILAFSETMELRGPFHHREPKIKASYDSLDNSDSLLRQKLALELSKVYWAEGNWPMAHKLAEESVYGENNNDSDFMFSALNQLGKVKSDLGFYKSALNNFNKIIDHVEQTTMRAIASKEIGHCYDKLGDIDTANQYFQTSKRLAKDDKFILAQIYNTQSLAHWHHGLVGDALNYIDAATELSIEIKNEAFIPAHTTNKGLILTDLGSFEEALDYFKKAEEIHEREQWHAVNYGGWGRALLRQGKHSDFSRAQDYLQNGLDRAIKVNYPETIAFYYGELALLACKKNHYLRAYELIRKALYLENWMGATKDCRFFNHLTLCSKIAFELGLNSMASESFKRSKNLQMSKEYSLNHESFQIREDCLMLDDLEKKMKL